MKRHFLVTFSLVVLLSILLCSAVQADTLTGLADVTVVNDALVSLRYAGTEYVVANGDLVLGTTTRWYIPADTGIETLWAEGDPAPAATVTGTSNPKDGDVGSKADNFLFRLSGSNDISSIDGIDFQETIFPFLTDTFFLFERGGNDTGTWQAILADGSLAAPVQFSAANVYADTGVNVGGQNAFGVVFKTDVPVKGVRITASGHDTLSISTPATKPTQAYNPQPEDGTLHPEAFVSLAWSPGAHAVSHRVYFGENIDDVKEGETAFVGEGQENLFIIGLTNSPYPEGLVAGKTYYWRVDEVNDMHPDSPWKGDVWSFTVLSKTAYGPDPPDSAIFVDPNPSLSWVAGLGAILHYVYFGDNLTEVEAGTGDTYKSFVVITAYTPLGPLELDTVYYWRIDEYDGTDTHKGDVWSFTTLPDIPITDPNLIGWWKLDEGQGATAFDWSGHDTHGTLMGGTQWADGMIDGALQFDGLNDSVEFANFVPPLQGTITFWMNPASVGPRGRIFGGHDAFEAYVQNELLHNQLFAAGDVPNYLTSNATIPTGTWTHVALTYDGTSYRLQTYLNGSLDGENSTADDIWNGGAFAFAHRAGRDQEYYEGLLDDFRIYSKVLTQDEIKKVMKGDPRLAWNPAPVDGSVPDIEHTKPLTWSAGDSAVQHDVYFGTDSRAVELADTSDTTGIYRGRQIATSYMPQEELEWGQVYYWRIDEYNNDETITKGRIWSFTVAEFILVDDFEHYDSGENQIWYAWRDGLGYGTIDTQPYYAGNGTGSAVGDETTPSYTEESIVNSGRQSMPYWYDNNKPDKAKYSEAKMSLVDPRDWAKHGVKALSLWFRGYPAYVGSFTEGPTGTYTMTGSGEDIWNIGPGPGEYHDEFHFAYKTLSGAGSIVAKVESVQNTNGWAKAGVMIRDTLDPNSVHAMMVVTPAQGVSFQRRTTAGDSSASDTQTGINAPQWVKLERDIGGKMTAFYSADGSMWTPLNTLTVAMNTPMYIGLALTSHNAALTCEAVFSNVTITGNVGQQWMHQDIGIQSNDPEPMYVAMANKTGTPAVVYHDDPNAAQIDTWTEWNIDLKDFADKGVILTDVNSIAIGFGNRNNPQAGGAGKMYFDDIRLYPPRYIPGMGTPLLADLNSDGVVDMADLEVMVADWLASGPALAGDVNTDSTVDFKDYAVLADMWFEKQLWPE